MKRYKAFTLIELLVVVSIIALLVSILLPALGKARDNAKGVACMSNMKQVGMTLTYYAQSANGYLPAGYVLSDNMPWYWAIKTQLNDNAIWDNQSSIFICPGEKIPDDTNQFSSFKGNFAYFRYGTEAGTAYYQKYDQVQRASEKVGVVEGTWTNNLMYVVPHWATKAATDTSGGGVAQRHSKGANYLWMDWHVTREAKIPPIDVEHWGQLFPWIP